MSNVQRSRQVLQSLACAGVQEIILCAGARNAPFVDILSNSKSFQTYSFFEERSAGFFALGRIQATQRPVAVLTTSGTAVAELLPAVIECEYSGQPLIVLSADRPQSYRGTGAPQTIVQPGIFSHYVEKSWDLGENDSLDLEDWSGTRPCHINICFDEPLIDGARVETSFEIQSPRKEEQWHDLGACKMAWQNFIAEVKKPLVLLGGMSAPQAEQVLPWLRQGELPVYVEAPSQLRGHPDLKEFEVTAGEDYLADLHYDGVIRIGSVCTLRSWRDLQNSKTPVIHFSDLPFAGLTRGTVLPLSALKVAQFPENHIQWVNTEWKPLDDTQAGEMVVKLQLFNRSEPGLVHALSKVIPEDSLVFLGNSLPIREWDAAAVRDRRFRVFANRGVNGIDGLISTFIGLADPDRENWAVIGDLSALYDLAGPWAARVRKIKNLNVVVLNNGGGKIFSRIFDNPLFENRHDLEFSGLAALWGWDYQKIENLDELNPAFGPRLIEIVPDNSQTAEFWQ